MVQAWRVIVFGSACILGSAGLVSDHWKTVVLAAVLMLSAALWRHEEEE